MSNTATLKLITINNTEIILNDVISFHVVKEYYTPYTTLSVEVAYPQDLGDSFKSVQLTLNGYVIHYGFIDTTELKKVSNFRSLKIKSKSFTSLLCQNQLEMGLKSGVSLNSLIDSFITIPNITHEDNSEVINYIYVKATSSLWEAIVNLTHKLNSGHPYVCDNNKVMVSAKENPNSFVYTQNMITSYGRGIDTTKIISDIHMQDIEGNYNVYNINNEIANDYNVVRHKHIDLDRQYLSNPEDALIHKINFSMRGYQFGYITYNGYQGEDICDIVNMYGYYPNCKISKLEVTGSNGGIITKVYAYNDNYITYET